MFIKYFTKPNLKLFSKYLFWMTVYLLFFVTYIGYYNNNKVYVQSDKFQKCNIFNIGFILYFKIFTC